MRNFINLVISKIKKQDYVIDSNIDTFSILVICFNKLIMLVRGFFKRIGLKKCGGNFFVGKNVCLKHKKYIRLGRCVTIEKFVEITALSKDGFKIGNNARLGSYTIVGCTSILKKIGKGIEIGDNFSCGDWCFFGAVGGIKIGTNVMMGQNVRMHSENHKFNDLNIPIKQQGVTNKGIIIEDDCWIGAGVTILDGVTIKRGSVIGADTLVNKNVEAYSVVVGNPAKVIRKRI